MEKRGVTVTIVNHVAVDIACPPKLVWGTILEEYIEARKFREIGYAIEPLDDPAAFLGGYHMRLEADGAVVDERICRVTEFDESALRLSLYADYLSAPNGMVVYATYHALAVGKGARYMLDCHSSLGLESPAGDAGTDVAATVADLTSKYDEALMAYLSGVKARLEGRS